MADEDRSAGAPADAAIDDRLPLTATVFEILLSLSAGPCHGYGIMQEVESRSPSGRKLLPGTLYRAIHRLLEGGLIEEVSTPAEAETEDARRRTYELTPLGRRVARAEAARLAAVVGAARARDLIGDETVTGDEASP